MKKAIFKWVLLAATFAILGCGDQSQKNSANHKAGMDAYAQGNFSAALEILQPFAEQGNAQAQFVLGMMHREGQAVQQDHKAAVTWLSKAAEQGNMEAQENLGLSYAKGLGVERDWVQADKWFSIAAGLGKETAMNNKKVVEVHMQPENIAQANALAQEWLEKHKQ